MELLEWFLSWFAGFSQVLLGFMLGAIFTGIVTVKFVIPRILSNPDIKLFFHNVKEGNELLTKALPIWKEILENQKQNNKHKTKN